MSRRYEYWMQDMTLELVNPPMSLGRNHRELARTAEIWAAYAWRRWGCGIARFCVNWNTDGTVSFRIAFEEGEGP